MNYGIHSRGRIEEPSTVSIETTWEFSRKASIEGLQSIDQYAGLPHVREPGAKAWKMVERNSCD